MKALTSTTFGHQKEAQAELYKQFIRPVVENASPAWCTDLASHTWRRSNHPERSPSHCDGLGSIHAHPTPLRGESKVLPLKELTYIRGSSSYLGPPTRNTPAPTYITPVTSRSSHNLYRSPLLHPPTPLDRNHNDWIHQHTVSRYIKSAPQNSLINLVLPSVSFLGRPDLGRFSTEFSEFCTSWWHFQLYLVIDQAPWILINIPFPFLWQLMIFWRKSANNSRGLVILTEILNTKLQTSDVKFHLHLNTQFSFFTKIIMCITFRTSKIAQIIFLWMKEICHLSLKM